MSKFIEIGGNYHPIETITKIEPRENIKFISTSFCKGYYKDYGTECTVYFSTKSNPNQNYYDCKFDNRTAEEMAKAINKELNK